MSNIYITTEDLQYLGYDPMPDTETQNDICITASLIADNFCYQSLGRETSEEMLDISPSKKGYNKIFLSYMPLIAVNSIYSYYNLKSSELIDPTNYEINYNLGYIELENWLFGRLKINYDHGYDNVPDDVKRAVILIASNLISDCRRRGQTAFENVKSLDDNQLKMQFFNDSGNDNIPPSAKKILMRYRRIR